MIVAVELQTIYTLTVCTGIHLRRTALFLATLGLAITAGPNSTATAATLHTGIGDTNIIPGACAPVSHIAEGRPEEDLTQYQRPFRCDGAVLMFFSNVRGHMMIQFASRQDGPIVGFAGLMEDNNFMQLSTLYLPSGRFATDTEGCKMFWKGGEVTDIYCIGVVETTNHKTVVNIDFKPTPRAARRSTSRGVHH